MTTSYLKCTDIKYRVQLIGHNIICIIQGFTVEGHALGRTLL